MLSFRVIICFLLSLLFSGAVLSNGHTSYLVAIESDDPITEIMFEYLAKKLDVNFEYIHFDNFSDTLQSVSSGYVDFLANVTYTEEREKTLDFTAPTNIEYVYLFTLDTFQLGQGKLRRIAVPAGSTYHLAITEVSSDITFVPFRDSPQAVELLHSGQVDGVVDGLSNLRYMTRKGLNATLFNDHLSLHPVSVVSPKGKHTELHKRIEEYAHSGDFQKLLRESIEQYQLNIRKQALRREVIDKNIDTSRPLRVKLENVKLFANYYPDGSVDGITADTIFQACRLLQLECQLASNEDETWASMYGSLENGTIDMLSPIAITEARQRMFYLSDSYYSPEAILVKRKNYKDDVYRSISQMLIERIGVIEGNFFESLIRGLLPEKELNLYSSQAELLEALLNNEVDYIVLTRAAFHSKLRKSKNILHITEEKMVGVIHSYDLAIGFPKTEQGKALAGVFSKAIHLLNLNQIVKKYDYPPDWYTTIYAQKRVNRDGIIRFSFVIAGLVFLIAMFHKRSITDELTKLKNRSAIYRKYGSLFPGTHTLVYMDINEFKVINDTYGHRVGDLVLKQLAEHITKFWSGDGYRIGGDEFVLVTGDSYEQAVHKLKNISKFSFYDQKSDAKIFVTTSIGWATQLKKHRPLDEVLHIADQSMYKSKDRFRQTNRD